MVNEVRVYVTLYSVVRCPVPPPMAMFHRQIVDCLMTKHSLVLLNLSPSHPNQVSFATNISASLFRESYFRKNLVTCCSISTSDSRQQPFDISVLEQYTQRVPSEILLVHAIVDNEEDEVLVYKGHSSSLMRATSADLEEAILPPNAIISKIDRLRGPYNPNMPQYIEEGLSWDQFFNFLESRGL